MVTVVELRERLAGVQLAVFEILWPAIYQLEAVHLDVEGSALKFFCQTNDKLEANDKSDCCDLIQELVDVAFPGNVALIVFNEKVSNQALEVMSPDIFRQIAKEVAPWRLTAGR